MLILTQINKKMMQGIRKRPDSGMIGRTITKKELETETKEDDLLMKNEVYDLCYQFIFGHSIVQ